MTQSELNSTKVGVIVLKVGGVNYVCSAFNMTMAINQIPVASCVVGCGHSILGDTREDNNAEVLYNRIQQEEMKDEPKFIDCTVCEVLDGTEYQIFKGVIVGASLVYKTGGSTIRAIRFEMMYSVCKLKAQPLTAYKNICGSHIVNTLLNTSDKSQNLTDLEAMAKQGMQRPGGPQTADSITEKLKLKIAHRDIATRISCLCDAFVTSISYTYDLVNALQSNLIGNFLHIKDYIKSAYRLDETRLRVSNSLTDTEFNISLCKWLMQGLYGGSIFDAILHAVMSSEFMLSMVPRFRDGKMEIKPSSAWGTNNTIHTIPLASVASINSSFHPLDHINDPNVFAVNFTDALDMRGNKDQSGIPGYLLGAYSTNPEAAKWLKLRFMNAGRHQEEEILTKSTSNYKWKLYPAPTWLSSAFVKTKQSAGKNVDNPVAQVQAIKDQKLRKNAKQQYNYPTQADQQNYKDGELLADYVAQSLYTMLYKQTATAELILLPDIRFGINREKYGFVLEEQLGELIDVTYIDKTDAAGISNKPLAIRGMVSAITFAYNAGQSASCTYQLTLSRVRKHDANEPKLICPLYAKITEK